ncbi:MAG: hypothetical protein ACE5FG_12900 [Myxococcota bacterium]
MAGSRNQRRRGRSRRNGGGRPDASRSAARRESPAGNGAGRPRRDELCELSPFSVFCALHLGITDTDGYADPSRSAVCRRFGLDPDQLEAYLVEHGLRPEDLHRAGFDQESARYDIEVAPEGISRVELARTLFEELRAGGAASGRPSAR